MRVPWNSGSVAGSRDLNETLMGVDSHGNLTEDLMDITFYGTPWKSHENFMARSLKEVLWESHGSPMDVPSKSHGSRVPYKAHEQSGESPMGAGSQSSQ